MTNERILELLEIEKQCVTRECDRNCAACDLVQEQDELEEMYTLAYCIIQDCTPERPIFVEDGFNGSVHEYCPSCKKVVRQVMNFCPNCGKALDWSGEPEIDATIVAREVRKEESE